jgi:WD40 repeat protein
MLVTGCCGAALLTASAQQPGGKGPMLPPVNPALAKLDITVTGLNGPGFAIVAGKDDLIVVACENGTLLAYKKDAVAAFKSGQGKPDAWKGHDGPVRALAWHGGPTLVSAGKDKKIHFWKMPEGKIAQSAAVDFRIRAIAMSQDGKSLAVAGESDTIQLFDVAAGKPTAKLTDKMDWTLSVDFSADGKQLLSGDYAGVARLWDVGGAKKVSELPAKAKPDGKTPPPDPVAVTCVAFGHDGKTAVLGMADGPIQIVSLGDGKIVRTLVDHTGPVTGFAFHPTGTLLASVSRDRTVKLWNPAAPQPAVKAIKSLDGHNAWIEGVVFIDQATKLATVSADETVRTWDLAEPPKKK